MFEVGKGFCVLADHFGNLIFVIVFVIHLFMYASAITHIDELCLPHSCLILWFDGESVCTVF